MKKKKGYLFWITGLSGSGKSEIAKYIHKHIKNKLGPTLLINGDDLRKIFKLYDYSKNGRIQNSIKFTKLAKFITDQNINLVFAVVGMMNKPRKWNRKNIKNYIEIFIDSKINQIIKKNKKRIYRKTSNNIVGKDIKAEYPDNPDIKITNNFKKDIKILSYKVIDKIDKIIG